MKEPKRSGRPWRDAALFFALAVIFLCGLVLFSGWLWAGTLRLFPGVKAGELALGGLRVAEARTRLEEAGYGRWLGKGVTVRFPDGSTREVTAAEAGMERDTAAMAEALYAYGRGGGFFRDSLDRLEALLFGAQPIDAALPEPDGEALRLAARRLAEETDRAAVPPALYWDEEVIRWIRGTPGQETDRASLALALEAPFREVPDSLD